MNRLFATAILLIGLLAGADEISALESRSIAPAVERLGLGESRLFLSAPQRALLDRRRKVVGSIIESPRTRLEPEPRPAVVLPPPPPVPTMELQGYVRRRDGKNTVWLNRQALVVDRSDDPALPVILSDDEDKGVRIRMPDGSIIYLKPGQRFQPTRGEIADLTG